MLIIKVSIAVAIYDGECATIYSLLYITPNFLDEYLIFLRE